MAPLADVLWAAQMLRPFGFDADLDPLRRRLLAGQDRSGGFQTATGFAAQTGERLHALPDVRDLLHVAGWCDKVFRYLAGQVTAALPEITETLEHRTMCSFQGETLDFHETCERVEIRQNKEPCYRWRKGTPWAEVAAPAFWLR